jgi:hypothetical protein
MACTEHKNTMSFVWWLVHLKIVLLVYMYIIYTGHVGFQSCLDQGYVYRGAQGA